MINEPLELPCKKFLSLTFTNLQVTISVALGLMRGVPLTFGDPKDSGEVGSNADFFAGGILVAALLITPLLFLLYLFGLLHAQQTVLVSYV